MSTVTMQAARALGVPRSARSAASPFVALWRAVSNAFKPAPQRPRTRYEDAARVRALAASVADTDPGFAADLYAAAARHDGYVD